jgi:hypothetical protein
LHPALADVSLAPVVPAVVVVVPAAILVATAAILAVPPSELAPERALARGRVVAEPGRQQRTER